MTKVYAAPLTGGTSEVPGEGRSIGLALLQEHVRIVGEEGEKKRLLEAFCDPHQSSPVIATTSRLLSTGIDVPDLKYVVIFRPVGSMVEFKQIIGRGTRLYPEKGKTSFEIVDFVGATSHFEDPVDSDLLPPGADASPRPSPTFVVDDGGFTVVSESVHVVDSSTGRLRLTEYGEYAAGVVRRLAPTPGDLATQWSRRPSRKEILTVLEGEGDS